MGVRADSGGGRRRGVGKLIAGVALLGVIAAAGIFIVMRMLSQSESGPSEPTQAAPTSSTTPVARVIPLMPEQVRIVDPPQGNRAEIVGSEALVDGDPASTWETDEYFGPADFGGIKPGMGILINLGEPTKVDSVRVVTAQGGATMELRTGTSDPGSTSEGDGTIATTYTTLGPELPDTGTTTVFSVPSDQTVQFLLVWISELPEISPDLFQISVGEVEVFTSEAEAAS
jgi:hypothetical protein